MNPGDVQIKHVRGVATATRIASGVDVAKDRRRNTPVASAETTAWLCDVELRKVARFVLATRDAHELYRRYGGFETLQQPDAWMARG